MNHQTARHDPEPDPDSFETEALEDLINSMAPCPVCYGEPVYLGTLGRYPQFRCRDCGIGYYTELEASC
jgi:hypothetical protein